MAEHQINYLQNTGLPIALTSIDKILNWGRSNSLWAMTYGLACCAIEMTQAIFSFGDKLGSCLMMTAARLSWAKVGSSLVTVKAPHKT